MIVNDGKTKQHYIDFLRQNGFNCFPIPEGKKIADWRYKAEETEPNQVINTSDNYGYIPVRGAGTAIIDFDEKEKFREWAEGKRAGGFLVIESPHGWHMPVKGLAGEINKIELFDPENPLKKILEIQGPKQYCVGPGSITGDGQYDAPGGEIYDMNGDNFHDLIDLLVKKYTLIGRKKNASSNAHLRAKFLAGEPPGNGQSNDYFFQAAIQCNTDGLTKEECVKKIELAYNSWTKTKHFSNRPWSNILAKIDDVYDNDYKVVHGNHRKKSKKDPVEIARDILDNNMLYSDGKTRDLYITDNGFLENITTQVLKTITKEYETTRSETSEVLHYLVGFADDLPPLNYDYIMFKNGMFDLTHNIITDKDPNIICAVGYKEYNYIDCPKCPRFLDLIDKHVDKKSINNLMACLSAVVTSQKELRMAVLYGPPGTGKTTLAETLTFSIGEMSVAMKVDDFFNDRATEARIKGKVLLYFQDTPRTWNDWSKIKVTTGENKLTVREMYQKSESIRNMLSVIISSNHLIEIDEKEEAPMFDRLALIFFKNKVRGTAQEDRNFSMDVARDEGEQIISYCLNLRKEKYRFDDNDVLKAQWDEIVKPEEILFSEHFYYVKGASDEGMSIHEIMAKLEAKYPDTRLDISKLQKVATKAGFTKRGDIYLGVTYRTRAAEGLAASTK